MCWRVSYSALNANPLNKTLLLVRREPLAMLHGDLLRLNAGEATVKCGSWHALNPGRLGRTYSPADICKSALKVIYSVFGHDD